jgi:zinc D-Ala-D-Ala carboxypeptidase
MNLSPHFTLEEMVRTGRSSLQTANTSEAAQFHGALKDVCVLLLEPIRAKFGPVRVTSGFRGTSVNKAIGGSPTSQHSKGEAADIQIAGVKSADIVKWVATESGIPFGQCILEQPPGTEWVHISLGAPYRAKEKCGQVLRFDGKSYTPLTFK